MSHALIPFAQ
jgi:hypothetical protein